MHQINLKYEYFHLVEADLARNFHLKERGSIKYYYNYDHHHYKSLDKRFFSEVNRVYIFTF